MSAENAILRALRWRGVFTPDLTLVGPRHFDVVVQISAVAYEPSAGHAPCVDVSAMVDAFGGISKVPFDDIETLFMAGLLFWKDRKTILVNMPSADGEVRQ